VPRPSSPVHAKASTNCPYLTLENPHHQRQFWNSCRRGAGRCINARRSRARRHDHSTQLDKDFRCVIAAASRQARDAATASISRTHSQCQRWGQIPRPRGAWPRAKPRSSFLEKASIARPPSRPRPKARNGGASRDRTDDLKLAKLALSQLSYGPER
jgi:hypothetical protein